MVVSFSSMTQFFADDLAAGQDGDITEHFLAAVAEAGGLDGDAGEGAAQLVHNQRGQRFAFHVLSDDQQLACRPAPPASSTGRIS